MKRIIALFTLVIFTMCGVSAREVPQSEALRIASMVLGEATRGGDVVVAWDSSMIGATRSGDAPTFYVVTPTSGVGFVIISGDDALAPILAYSNSYAAPAAELLPKNFEGWLSYVDTVVRYAREHNVEASSLAAERWNEEYKPVDAVLLNTARWSQLAPYYNECPIDGDAHSLTGCTQTAAAIIMYHNRWPERATGVTEAYTTLNGLDVPQRDLNHAYDWDNMLETYVEGEYNDAQAAAVAVLMADLGHAFKAEYTAVDTGAMPDMWALYQMFGYSPASRITTRRGYSDEYWTTLIRCEIEAGRPIFYAGYTADYAGHAFVLDGVDANNYFHVNWGWGGVYDGFFMLDGLALDVYEFDYSQWAIFGMTPMRDSDVDNWLCITSSGLKTSTTQFERGVPFTIEPVTIANYAQLEFKGEICVGVCDKNGHLKSWATEPQSFTLPSMYGGSSDAMNAAVDADIVEGDRLCLFYRSSGSDKWYKMSAFAEGAASEIVMRYPAIGATTSFDYDKVNSRIVVDYDDDVKSALYRDGEYVEDGVTITRGMMTISTQRLIPAATYTILLVREGVEQREITFTIKGLKK